MTHCPACRKDVHPIQEMGEDMRMRDRCGACGCALDAPAAPTAPVAPVVAVIAPAPKAAAPADVLTMVRARLDVVRAEIRDVRALEAEAEMLQRMLDAAEPKPLRAVK